MSSTSAAPQAEQPWPLINLDEFNCPTEPASEAVRMSMQAIWQRLRHGNETEEFPVEELPELKLAPRAFLDRLLPEPQWAEEIYPSLAERLDQHSQDNPEEARFLVIVAPPYLNLQEAARQWAMQTEHTLLAPPTPDEILDFRTPWPAQWPADPETYWVIAGLEACYLRHHNGLTWLHHLVDDIWRRRQRGVLVCDSWAWAYLSRASGVNLLQARPLTLAPLHADELDHWFAKMVRSNARSPVIFRRADNGKPTLRMDEEDETHYSGEYLTHVAAYSRGNPAVAWTIWRQSLSIAVSAESEEEIDARAQAEASDDPGRTVWVRPWDKLTLPSLPPVMNDQTAFLIHALLLHNGLELDTLYKLPGLAPRTVAGTLHRLQTANIVTYQAEKWRIAPAAYPAVRRWLRQEGFLVDTL